MSARLDWTLATAFRLLITLVVIFVSYRLTVALTNYLWFIIPPFLGVWVWLSLAGPPKPPVVEKMTDDEYKRHKIAEALRTMDKG